MLLILRQGAQLATWNYIGYPIGALLTLPLAIPLPSSGFCGPPAILLLLPADHSVDFQPRRSTEASKTPCRHNVPMPMAAPPPC